MPEETLVSNLRVNASFQKNVKNNKYLSELLTTAADYIEGVEQVNKDKLNQNMELMQAAALERYSD